MPPRKKSAARPPALTDDDVADLRARVSDGEKPRVVVRTPSAAVPAGTRGNVVRIGNPNEGEYIVVRLGRDEVPFAPAELSLTTRARQPAAPPRAATTRTSSRPATKAGARAARRGTPAEKPAAAKRAEAKPAAAKGATAPAAVTRAAKPASAPGRARSGRSASKRRATPPLTVTLRFTDDVWTVEAQRGARRIARPSTVRPGAVKAFAELVDDAEVRAAMAETVATSRAVVEERAQKLRAELEAAEATLRDYEARRR